MTHNIFQRAYEHITYKEFSSHRKQLNDEQRTIVDNILHKKTKNFRKPFCVFFDRVDRHNKYFQPNVYHTKHVMILYKENPRC